MNGQVWVDSKSLAHTIAICNAILHSEYMMTHEKCRDVVNSLVERL